MDRSVRRCCIAVIGFGGMTANYTGAANRGHCVTNRNFPLAETGNATGNKAILIGSVWLMTGLAITTLFLGYVQIMQIARTITKTGLLAFRAIQHRAFVAGKAKRVGCVRIIQIKLLRHRLFQQLCICGAVGNMTGQTITLDLPVRSRVCKYLMTRGE